jgi:hypothetical protein
MRDRVNVLIFALTVAAAGAVDLGSPPPARAMVTPTHLQYLYCCTRDLTRCCGNNWCAITERGCASG